MFVKVHRVMCFFVTALLILLQITCQNDVEKEFFCKNKECSESISEFTVQISYTPDLKGKIHANKGDRGVILAKPKDERTTNLYKVKIKDSDGFLPSNCIKELKKGKADILVNLTVPVNTHSSVPSTSNPSTLEEKSDEIGDPTVINTIVDDINSTSSIPNVEKSHNGSVSTVADDLSSKVKNDANETENLVSKTEPVVKEDSSENQVTSDPSINDQTKKDTTSDKTEKESVKNLQAKIEKMQNESIYSNDSATLQNTSLEANESDIVSVINDSENISESITQELPSEKENPSALVNSPDITPVHEELNASETNLNIAKTQNGPNTSISSLENIPKEGFFVENNTDSNVSANAETSNNLAENLQQSLESKKTDNFTSPEKVDVTLESQLNDTSQNHSVKSEVSNNMSTSDIPKTEAVPPATNKVTNGDVVNIASKIQIPSETSNNISENLEQSSESTKTDDVTASDKVELADAVSDTPEMRTFPEKKQHVDLKEPKTLIDETTVSTDSDNENITSEKSDSTTNDTFLLTSNDDKNEQISEVTQPQDLVTPIATSNEIPSPPYIETTTQSIDTTLPNSSEETFNSSESIPLELASGTTESTIAEETPSYIYSDPYKGQKPKPYPSLFPNTATEKQPPSVAEKTDQVSTQEIDESKPETSSEQLASANEPASVPLDVHRKPGLSGFIHTSRKQVNENKPESIVKPETSEEKSAYETIAAFLPDLSGVSWSFIETTTSFLNFGWSSQQEALEREECSAEQFCGTDRLNSHMDKVENPESENIVEIPILGVVQKQQITFVSGILTTIFLATILLWWLMNYFNKNRKVGLLISRINQLENKLLVSTKEIASLQNKLDENGSQAEAKKNVADIKRITEVYEHKINQYKKRIVELDDKVLYLEKELENVSNSALEMHKLLENSLATQAQSKVALDEVETLRALTESQENEIDDLKKEINAVVTENQCLKVDNEMNKSTIKKFEKECNAQTKKNVELSEKNRNLTLQLDKELENSNVLEGNYKTEIYELRSKLEDVEMNLKRSEFQVKELQRVVLDKQDNVPSSKNDVQLKIQISTLEAMNNELSGQLNEQKNARRMLEDHVGDVTKELNNLKKSFENSEKERNQAVTKLQVLTQYFKDKEVQLHKELEAKDKLSLERDSKDQSLSQKLALMREEINNLKVQNEALQKEIQDQEASYKVQVANAEQKAREHWFEFRQADRKYKECQQEAAILRNKILILETNMSTISNKADDKNNSGLNGEISGVSPILYHPSLSPELLPYPSPSDFIPPPPSPLPSHMSDFFPPEPIYSPDERLPPLGGRRAPSPPPPLSPDDEFGPPPPLMKFPSGRNHNVEPPLSSGYSRRTPPPSGRHRSQFRPRQPRSSIDSPSSGMSLESLDKSGR